MKNKVPYTTMDKNDIMWTITEYYHTQMLINPENREMLQKHLDVELYLLFEQPYQKILRETRKKKIMSKLSAKYSNTKKVRFSTPLTTIIPSLKKSKDIFRNSYSIELDG